MDYKRITAVLPVVSKYTNSANVFMWKLGMGKFFNLFPAVFGKTMVVDFSRSDAKSPAQLPLVYFAQGETLYCTAFLGAGPEWHLKVIANPQVEVWLADGWYAGKAELVEDEEERAQALTKLQSNSGVMGNAWKRIKASQEVDDIENAIMELPVLRIKRQSPCTGAEGPGSMAWLWPLFFILLFFRRRRR
jgi:MYXO-CTERM domain-containing protein